MPPPAPKSPWYQYSLRSLLLFTTFVAVLCALGRCTHWLLAVAVGSAVMIGGIAGRIVAGTRIGFLQGAVFGVQFAMLSIIACVIVGLAFPPFSNAPWPSIVVLGTATIVGGALGGFTVRPRSGR
jgi:uncharacterized membrane protein